MNRSDLRAVPAPYFGCRENITLPSRGGRGVRTTRSRVGHDKPLIDKNPPLRRAHFVLIPKDLPALVAAS